MAKILCIETATGVCSVCLSEDGEILSEREDLTERAHASKLTPFIASLFKETGWSANRLDLIAVSMGPGSYTGLRIGVSAAKGLAYGAGVPLAGISSLQALACGILKHPMVLNRPEEFPGQQLFLPMIDARRMEVFTAIYNRNNEALEDTRALIVETDSFDTYTEKHHLFCFGDGAEKCKPLLSRPGIWFPENFRSSARHLIPLAEERLRRQEFADPAYFEPFYLKDFIPTLPRKNIFMDPEKKK